MLNFTNNGKGRRRGRQRTPAWLKILGAVVAAAGCFAAANAFLVRRSAPTFESRVTVNRHAGGEIVNAVSVDPSPLPDRAIYNYSVIPGGAQNAQELAHAIQTDGVVADHYRNLDPATMRTETVAAERYAYVSYRKNDRVFWTKNKVRIYEGETILTNGATEIRGRCGNGISMEPLLPTSEDEPDETQFDALTDVGPLLVSFNLTPAGLPLVEVPTQADPGSSGPIVPFGVGGGGIASGAVRDAAADGNSFSVPPDISDSLSAGCAAAATMNVDSTRALIGAQAESDPCAMDASEFNPSTSDLLGDDPFGDDPSGDHPSRDDPSGGDPFGDDPFGHNPSGDDPFGDDSLVLQALLADDPGSDLSVNTRLVPTPVPEPATLLLFGSGIAGLLARRRQAKG